MYRGNSFKSASANQAFFWCNTNCKMKSVKITEYDLIPCVIPKEGFAGTGKDFFCYDNDKDFKTCFSMMWLIYLL